MTDAELAMFIEYISGCKTYLEFGCGGSTCVAGALRIPMIDSVETDAAWIEKCRVLPELEDRTVRIHHVDIGAVGDWGKPKDFSRVRDWPDYFQSIWPMLRQPPDVILIDGRWRVACAAHAILEAPRSAVILFQGFWGRRYYHGVLPFVDVIDRADNLAVLRSKKDIDLRALSRLAAKAAVDFR